MVLGSVKHFAYKSLRNSKVFGDMADLEAMGFHLFHLLYLVAREFVATSRNDHLCHYFTNLFDRNRIVEVICIDSCSNFIWPAERLCAESV